MDIVMTRKGREHYASGTFDPTYYAFYDDEVIYDIQYVTGSNQVWTDGAGAFIEGLSTMDDVGGGLQLVLEDAFGDSVTFIYDTSKNETESTATRIGTALTATTNAKATEAVHRAIAAAIAAGDLNMSITPANSDTLAARGDTNFTIGQNGDVTRSDAGFLTTIEVPLHIKVFNATAGADKDFKRDTNTKSGGEQQEVQNAIGRRIRDSITLKNQTGWYEARTAKTQQKVTEPFFRVLGKSSRLTSSAPAWEVNVVDYRGEFSGSIKYIPLEFSGSGKGSKKSPYTDVILTDQQAIRKYNKEKIPQLNIFCDYDVRIVDTLDWLATAAERAKREELRAEYEKTVKCDDDDNCAGSGLLSMKSGGYVSELRDKYGGEISLLLKKSTDDFLLDFVENNVEDTDFTLEVYEYIYDGDNNVREIKQLNFSDEDHSPDFVEYYFDLTTDKETEIDLNIKYIQESLEVEEEPSPCPPGSSPFGTGPTSGLSGVTPDGYSCKKDSDCGATSKCTNAICAQPAAVNVAGAAAADESPGLVSAAKAGASGSKGSKCTKQGDCDKELSCLGMAGGMAPGLKPCGDPTITEGCKCY